MAKKRGGQKHHLEKEDIQFYIIVNNMQLNNINAKPEKKKLSE